jgi:rod shape-determining protein MreB
MAIGSVIEGGSHLEAVVRGRDLITGLPREILITDSDVREAISQSIDTLVEAIREVLETTPPEILSDIMRSGIMLAGGGALLKGLDVLAHPVAQSAGHSLPTTRSPRLRAAPALYLRI